MRKIILRDPYIAHINYNFGDPVWCKIITHESLNDDVVKKFDVIVGEPKFGVMKYLIRKHDFDLTDFKYQPNRTQIKDMWKTEKLLIALASGISILVDEFQHPDIKFENESDFLKLRLLA